MDKEWVLWIKMVLWIQEGVLWIEPSGYCGPKEWVTVG